MKTVEVRWLDAWNDSEELTAEHAQSLRPIKRRQVGYLLKQSDADIVLAAGVYEQVPGGVDSFCDITVIPMGIVTGVSVLEEE
jgi:hypothetical protein